MGIKKAFLTKGESFESVEYWARAIENAIDIAHRALKRILAWATSCTHTCLSLLYIDLNSYVDRDLRLPRPALSLFLSFSSLFSLSLFLSQAPSVNARSTLGTMQILKVRN